MACNRSMLLSQPAGSLFLGASIGAAARKAPPTPQDFDIRPARTPFQHAAATRLVRQMYERRGYDTQLIGSGLDDPHRITLAIWRSDVAVATLTVGRDSADGLFADALYRRELDALRHQGRVVCEASSFAIHPDFSSNDLLHALFHSALHHSRDILGASDAVIEVNPRHATYYRNKFGFTQIGELRQCPRVDAPAVLLHRNLDEIEIFPRSRLLT